VTLLGVARTTSTWVTKTAQKNINGKQLSNKRKRMNFQTPTKEAEQIQTTNRFESLSEPPCVKSQNGTPTNLKTPDTSKKGT
jgi:hypothetical protein